MNIHKHTLKDLGYNESQYRSIMAKVGRLVKTEVKQVEIVARGNRKDRPSMNMLVFLTCIDQDDFIRGCDMLADADPKKKQFWIDLSEEIAGL